MKMLGAVTVVVMSFGMGAAAQASGLPGGGGPLPSVRSQIQQEIKQTGAAKGLVKPSLRLTYAPGGKSVTAYITAMSTFTGGMKPLAKPVRMTELVGKFKIGQVMEGRIATPVKTGGRVWSGLMR